MKFSYQLGPQIFEVTLEKTEGGYRANGASQVQVIGATDGELNLLVDGHAHTVHFAIQGAARFIAFDGKTYTLNAATQGASRHDATQTHSDEDAIRAPMPGQVRAVQINESDAVTRGQTLLILEAMKMEIKIIAPRAGKIAKLNVTVGDLVEREQVVAEMA